MSGFYYNGFSVHAILIHLNLYCDSLKIEKIDGSWLIYANSQEHGEFEHKGSLTLGLMHAFKPFLERAEQERNSFKEMLDEIRNI